ncbi:MAG: hypothetical protein DMF63_09385 [Acidobacteria bacterium]|nr:MAG: hypothetical protein DMF63_09385 [Acidobacteriota bacterium]
MPATLDTILSRLQKVARNGNGWLACCPAHEDKKPSLSIDLSDTGAILLKCFAGCTTLDVCTALGIKTAELFPEGHGHGHPHRGHANGKHETGPIVDRYIYPDETGKPVLSVTRHVPKTFKQWHPAPNAPEGWALGRKARNPTETDARLVLYRLPQILEAVALGHTIYVCEGEKDANAMALAGLDSTTAPGGADQWLETYTATLKGAHVVVIADKDEKGREGAVKRCLALKPVSLSCKYLEMPGTNVKDPADFLTRGGTARNIIDLAAAQPEFDPDNPPETADRHLPPLDLASEVCPNPPATPDLIIEDILHRGLKMIVGGPSKAHKSWTYLSIAISVALGEPWLRFRTNAVNVLYVNFEVPRPFLIRRVILSLVLTRFRLARLGYSAGNPQGMPHAEYRPYRTRPGLQDGGRRQQREGSRQRTQAFAPYRPAFDRARRRGFDWRPLCQG